MAPEKKPYIAQEAYEKLADEYAARVDTKPHNAYREFQATLSLIPDVNGKKVLDAGCGTGRYTRWLLDHGAEVVGFDGSPQMLGHARMKAGETDLRLHDLREPLTFLEDGSVDLVLSTLVMDYLEDWGPVLGEFRRILSKKGTFVMSVQHPTIDFIKELGMKDYWPWNSPRSGGRASGSPYCSPRTGAPSKPSPTPSATPGSPSTASSSPAPPKTTGKRTPRAMRM